MVYGRYIMYTVYLIDDEPWVLKGLRKSIAWEDLGFSIIGDNTSPTAAFEVIKALKPDVIFCDIRMPGISGLELLEKTRQAEIDSEFIILSGFAEFSYAKTALKHNAFYYLLKPLDKNECTQMLRRLLLQLHLKSILQCHFVDSDFFEQGNVSQIKLLQSERFPCDKKYYQAICTDGNPYELISKHFSDSFTRYLIYCSSHERYILFLNTEHPVSPNDFSDSTIDLGISETSHDAESLSSLAYQANICCNHFFESTSKITQYRFLRKSLTKDATGQIFELLFCYTNKEAFLQASKEYIALYSLTIEEFLDIYLQIVKMLDAENILPIPKNCEDFMVDFLSVSICLSTLYQTANNICSLPYDAANSNMFDEIIAYINQNYTDSLSLSDISEQFHLNLTYICDLFRKNLHTTFVGYLKSLRLKEAKRLLIETTLPISEIASKVGYDALYFSKLFREQNQISPVKFRKIIRTTGDAT